MGVLSRDTHPTAERFLIDALRRLAPADRLSRAMSLRDAGLSLARVRILERWGKRPEREIRLRLASLWLDPETMRRAFSWDPDEHGF
jgi:hypothetical protein